MDKIIAQSVNRVSAAIRAGAERIRTIKLMDAFYPILLVIIVCVTIIAFFFATRSISKVLDMALSDSSSQGSSSLIDMDALRLVAGKLGIDIVSIVPQQPSAQQPAPSATNVQALANNSATTTPTADEKKMLKITVLNATKMRGLAAEMKSDFESHGYTVQKTGNANSTETIIQIKKSAEKFKDDLVAIVKGKYPNPKIEILPESDTSDVIVSIYK